MDFTAFELNGHACSVSVSTSPPKRPPLAVCLIAWDGQLEMTRPQSRLYVAWKLALLEQASRQLGVVPLVIEAPPPRLRPT